MPRHFGQTTWTGEFDGTEHLPAFDIFAMADNQAETNEMVKLCARQVWRCRGLPANKLEYSAAGG